jgi:hypothetical protein
LPCPEPFLPHFGLSCSFVHFHRQIDLSNLFEGNAAVTSHLQVETEIPRMNKHYDRLLSELSELKPIS